MAVNQKNEEPVARLEARRNKAILYLGPYPLPEGCAWATSASVPCTGLGASEEPRKQRASPGPLGHPGHPGHAWLARKGLGLRLAFGNQPPGGLRHGLAQPEPWPTSGASEIQALE